MSAATCHHGHRWLSVDSETSLRGVVALSSGSGMVYQEYEVLLDTHETLSYSYGSILMPSRQFRTPLFLRPFSNLEHGQTHAKES